MDNRRPQRLLDSRRQADGELSDSDDEGEGGRRNHMRHRDPDSIGGNDGGGRKFGMGIGIMTSSGSTNTHGAGPSGHTTAARVLSTTLAEPLESLAPMDVDTPPNPTDSGATSGTPVIATTSLETSAPAPEPIPPVIETTEAVADTSTTEPTEMVLDEPSSSKI